MRALRRRLSIVLAAAVLLTGGGATLGAPPEGTPRRVVVNVKGLACPFCVYGLEKHLRKLPGATSVRVDLGKGEAAIDLAPGSKVTDEDIRKAVKKAGFTVARIHRGA